MPASGPALLIAGAGYVGRRVLDAEADAVGLAREARGARIHACNLDDRDALPAGLERPRHVLYTVPPARDAERDARLEHFLGALAAPPKRFVYLSTTGVYGDCGGRLVDETAPLNAQSARARRRVRAERHITRWCADHDSDCVILRVPAIYGPGRLGLDRRRDGEAILSEADAGPGNRIHVDDLVECCRRALSPETPADIYNLGDGDHRSSSWFAKEVARQAGLPPPPELSRADAERRFSAARLSFLNESRRADTRRMREVLKPELRYADPAAGIAASLAASD